MNYRFRDCRFGSSGKPTPTNWVCTFFGVAFMCVAFLDLDLLALCLLFVFWPWLSICEHFSSKLFVRLVSHDIRKVGFPILFLRSL